jgi:fusicocca-2,10(14)-diene synthase/ophiobolin F synthase
MEYPNSRLVDPSSYDTTLDGLCTNIPVRVHRNAELADRGAFRAQKDWQRFFGSLPPRYAGNPGPEYNSVSTCFPEMLPDRLELVAYIMETYFLIDDVMDAAESLMAAATPFMADFLQAYNVVMAGGEAADLSCSPAASIMTGFAKEMVDIDAERAKEAFRWFEKWVKLMLSHPSGEKGFQNLDEYLEYRCVNFTSQYVPTSGLFPRHAVLIKSAGRHLGCSCSAWASASPKTSNRHGWSFRNPSGFTTRWQMTTNPGSASTRWPLKTARASL